MKVAIIAETGTMVTESDMVVAEAWEITSDMVGTGGGGVRKVYHTNQPPINKHRGRSSTIRDNVTEAVWYEMWDNWGEWDNSRAE